MTLGLLVFALRALARRKARAVALGGGLAFAVALVAAVLFLSDALRGESDAARNALPDLVVSRLRGGRPATPGRCARPPGSRPLRSTSS